MQFSNFKNWKRKVQVYAKKFSLSRKLSIAFTIATLISGLVTYSAFALPEGPNVKLVLPLLYLNFFLLLCLVILLGRTLLRTWQEKRKGSAGSGLQLRFMTLFLIITAVPTMLVTAFSAVFFGIVMQAWFGEQVYNAVRESRNVAEAYYKDYSESISLDVASVINDIDTIRMDRATLENLLAARLLPRGVDEALIFDSSGKIIAKVGYTLALLSEHVPFPSLNRADMGGVAVIVSDEGDWIKALAKIPDSIFYLYAGRMVDASVIKHIERATIAVENYEALESQRSTIEMTFIAIFIIVAFLLMFLSAWIGIIVASRLSKPVVKLIDAASKVKDGDYTVRVDEYNVQDEIGLLTRTFNKMIRHISATTRQLEERRVFIETVLAGVSAGVVGTDNKGVIRIINKSVTNFAGIDVTLVKGKSILDFVPELEDMLTQIKKGEVHTAYKEIKTYKDGVNKVLLVRVTAENPSSKNGKSGGFVFTFDDITSLQAAERKAAWADAARRVAHEIKNPLTPIQLAAERLKRKYADQIIDDKDSFLICIDTIIRQVSEIGSMVDEFSSFARMPAPIMNECCINELVRQTVFLQQVANQTIKYIIEAEDKNIFLKCDARQISRIIINLLKNAQESIADSPNKDYGVIKITIGKNETGITLSITDNGRGLPDGDKRNTITEPYVTTKPKGTGLGLAIVKKIMEDHGGYMTIKDIESDSDIEDNNKRKNKGKHKQEKKRGAIAVLHFSYEKNNANKLLNQSK